MFAKKVCSWENVVQQIFFTLALTIFVLLLLFSRTFYRANLAPKICPSSCHVVVCTERVAHSCAPALSTSTAPTFQVRQRSLSILTAQQENKSKLPLPLNTEIIHSLHRRRNRYALLEEKEEEEEVFLMMPTEMLNIVKPFTTTTFRPKLDLQPNEV